MYFHALLLGDGLTGNAVQANPDKPANAHPDMQQTLTDEDFQSNNVLNEVELELIWLGEDSQVCTACRVLNFNLTLSTNRRRLH
jgi:hypothetical protein